MPHGVRDPFTGLRPGSSGGAGGGFNNLIAPSGNLYTSGARQQTGETYLPPEKQQAFATLNQFLQDPLQNIAGRMGPLLRSLMPSEQAARQGYLDVGRRAGGLRSGAFAQGARQLEGDIFGRRAETATRASLGALGPILGGYQTALTGIPALSREQATGQNLSEFGGRGGGGGSDFGGFGFGFDTPQMSNAEREARLRNWSGTGTPTSDSGVRYGTGPGGMGAETYSPGGQPYYDPYLGYTGGQPWLDYGESPIGGATSSPFDYSGGEYDFDFGGGGGSIFEPGIYD